MRYRMFYFGFEDGSYKWMRPQDAYEFSKENNLKIVRDDYQKDLESPIKMTKDGFKVGWNPGLGMHVRGLKHYSQVLKEKGLMEMGKERGVQNEKKKIAFVTPAEVKASVEIGAKLSGNEIEALETGKYDVPIEMEKFDDKGGFGKV